MISFSPRCRTCARLVCRDRRASQDTISCTPQIYHSPQLRHRRCTRLPRSICSLPFRPLRCRLNSFWSKVQHITSNGLLVGSSGCCSRMITLSGPISAQPFHLTSMGTFRSMREMCLRQLLMICSREGEARTSPEYQRKHVPRPQTR